MKFKQKPILILLLFILALPSCMRLDPPYVPILPDFDDKKNNEVSLTVNWDKRDPNVDIPPKYVVMINSQKLEFNKQANQLPTYDLNTYPAWIYSSNENITVNNKGIATVKTTNNEVLAKPSWFFSSYLNIAYTDKKENYTAEKRQQTRLLNLEIKIIDNNKEPISEIHTLLTGVANTLDIANNTVSGEGLYTKIILSKTNEIFTGQAHLIGLSTESIISPCLYFWELYSVNNVPTYSTNH